MTIKSDTQTSSLSAGGGAALGPTSGSPTPAITGAAAVLAILTFLNLFNYLDRWVLASVLGQMERDPIFAGRTQAEFGLFNSAFLVTYMVVSPIAGLLATRVRKKWLIFGGVVVWSLATFATGLAQSYGQVLIARCFIGFGEAGYATIAPAMISALYSADRRARMLSIFYLAIPVGTAIGFAAGGNIGQHLGWRAAFFIAGGPGLLFALLLLKIPESVSGVEAKSERPPLGETLLSLFRNVPYMLNNLGTTLLTFSLGAAAYWMPKYLETIHNVPQGKANTLFGASVVLAGILGTAAGGTLADRWSQRDQSGYYRVAAIGLIIAAPLFYFAPNMASANAVMAVAFFSQIFMFLTIGPTNAAILAGTPRYSHELAMGFNILAIHLLGDALSPTLVGWLVDLQRSTGATPKEAWSFALSLLAIPTLLGGLVLWIAADLVRKEARRSL